jgi:hypothetical protein
LEQAFGKLLFVAEVHCALNVATIVLVLETAIDDHFVVIYMVIDAIEDLDESSRSDTRETLGLACVEMGKLECRDIIHIHHGLQTTWLIAILVLLGIHDIARVLKHTQGSSELGGTTRWGACRFADGIER